MDCPIRNGNRTPSISECLASYSLIGRPLANSHGIWDYSREHFSFCRDSGAVEEIYNHSQRDTIIRDMEPALQRETMDER
jgi:hypothetical protein